MSHLKIVPTKEFRDHMTAHSDSFLVPYSKVIDLVFMSGVLDNLKEKVEIVSHTFDSPIGYNEVVEVTENESVFYETRKGRSEKSPFVLRDEKPLSNTVTMILIRKKGYSRTYSLVTMFVGESAPKEVTDSTITTKEEFMVSKEYWSKHAFVKLRNSEV